MKAKLLVPSQFANDFVGKREAVMVTGVDIHIPVGSQILDCLSENELVIEVSNLCFLVISMISLLPIKITICVFIFSFRLWESIGM